MDFDVDDVLTEKARKLQRYLLADGQTDCRVRCLGDVPWLVVKMFELLTGETIPPFMKPFNTLAEQSETLQRIIDTLEKTLRLPLSHVTGMGVARLERRQLEDLLQILQDIARHCYPEVGEPSNKEADGAQTPADERLTVSQLTCQQSPEGATCTPRISVQTLERSEETTKREATAHVADIPSYVEMAPAPKDRIPSRPTLREARDARVCDPGEESDTTNLKGFCRLRPENGDSFDYDELNMLMKPSRFEPYSTSRRERNCLERKKRTPNVHALKSASCAKRNGDICRKPSVKSFSSPFTTVSHNIVSSYSSYSDVKQPLSKYSHRPVDVNQPVRVPEVESARCRSASRCVANPQSSSKKRNPSRSRASDKDLSTKQKYVIGLDKIRSGSKTRKPPASKVKPGPQDKPARQQSQRRHLQSVSSPRQLDRKRKPSVVSTKVRRHSRPGCTGTPGSPGPCHRPVRRGEISPQTTSLCSSLKLLEEFDYVKRRLAQIDRKIAEYELAIHELKEEEVRLQYVLSHVHRQAGRAVQEGRV